MGYRNLKLNPDKRSNLKDWTEMVNRRYTGFDKLDKL